MRMTCVYLLAGIAANLGRAVYAGGGEFRYANVAQDYDFEIAMSILSGWIANQGW